MQNPIVQAIRSTIFCGNDTNVSVSLNDFDKTFFHGFLPKVTDEMLGVFPLSRNSGNSGWDVNGTHVFGSFHWKISGINGTSEKVR